MIESYLSIPPILGGLGLLCALGIYIIVSRYPVGGDKVKKIGDQIHLGAMTFMRREYTYLAGFVVVLVLLSLWALGTGTATAVLVGALSSAVAG